MKTLNTVSGEDNVMLRGGDVGRVMALAGREHTLFRVRFADDGAEVTGRVCHLSADEMDVQLEPDQVVAACENATRKCAVVFEAGGQSFCFSTVLIGVSGSVVALRQPIELSTKQRRRFWRARVRASTPVEIAVSDGSLRCDADILNLSPDGMACRVERRRADALSPGDHVTLKFEVEGHGPWEVRAEVRAKTDASDQSRVILRLRFDSESVNSDLRERLKSLTTQH